MQNGKQRIVSDEIGLKDIVDMFKRNWMWIVLWGLAGLLFSTAYVALVHKKYEAQSEVQMANGSEEPVALIQRLRMPTVYPVEVRQSCGVNEDGDFSDYLDGKLKIEVVKNVANVVDMKVVAGSTDQARKCTESIVAMIVAQQRGLIEERLAGRQEQLRRYQQALREEQQQLEKIQKSELGNFGYLSKLDKLSWLRTRIDALQEEALLSHMHPAKLLFPIYVSGKQVSPKVSSVLLSGIMLGLMIGWLYALGREGWRKIGKSDS